MKKEWLALQERVGELESLLTVVTESYGGPKRFVEAVSSAQYKRWMQTEWCGEPAAEDMKSHTTFAR